MATTTNPLFYSFTFLFLLLAAATENCNPDDKKALLSIQKFYNNASIFSSWTASTDCCTHWSMLKCDRKTHRITSLSISSNSLPGLISPSISNLPFLQYLTLRKLPNLTGPIPQSLSNLKFLLSLWLDFNSLTGSIPNFLHTLKFLNYVNLSFNNLTGSIPPSLFLAPSLDYLRLDFNQLTGTIPNSIGSVTEGEIFGLILAHNQFTGPIPKSIGKLNITVLNLGHNDFTGDASFLFGADKPVNQMDLSGNSFEFDMSMVVVPSQINWLRLEHNLIYGSLPESLTKLTNMNNFNVSFNRLCGKIPSGGRLGEFSKYEYLHNKCLCGSPLPACELSVVGNVDLGESICV